MNIYRLLQISQCWILILAIQPASFAQRQNVRVVGEREPVVLTAEDLELTEEEKLLSMEMQVGDRPVNVAEKYRNLLTRDALNITPSEKGDPMVARFIGEKVLLEELTTDMTAAYEKEEFERAMVFAKSIVNQFPESVQANEARDVMRTILEFRKGREADPVKGRDPELAAWVSNNTKAILADEQDPVVLIGYDVLRVGESVPGYENHVVDEIREESVVYRVSNEFKTKRFEVIVIRNQ